MCGRGIEPELDKMLGSHTSWILQAQRSEIRTSGEVKPNFPSAPATKFRYWQRQLRNFSAHRSVARRRAIARLFGHRVMLLFVQQL